MTVWSLPDQAVELRREPSRDEMFAFYGLLGLRVRGPAGFAAEVAEYFWPQVQPTSPTRDATTLEVLVGSITATALARLPRQPIALYRSPDGYVPDWNDGIQYMTPWDVDRLVVNPHTSTQIVVAGRHVRVLNPNLSLAVRGAIRVIKQLVTTTFESDGAVIMHAAAFAVDGRAVALVGGKGSGKTTTVLAAVADGATLISNDRLYARPTPGLTTVVGWTDPIRVIAMSPDQPKQMIPLIRYAHGDRSKVAEQPVPLAAVVVPDVRPDAVTVACVDLGEAIGKAAVRAQVLPQRVRWLGLELGPSTLAASLTVPRYLRLSYAYQDAHVAATTLRDTLRDTR